MRGTLLHGGFQIRPWGIIPAYAGNTRIALFRFRKIWDHPRVCGEHWSYQLSTMFPEGSSPRMRGTQTMADQPQATPGIIPAYAGNTTIPVSVRGPTRDHPRVCGEHFLTMAAAVFCEGSSPRMRGTPTPRTCISLPTGIIPAYAGNTRGSTADTIIAWDHPRVCGEHTTVRTRADTSTGSSPRMRGTLRRACTSAMRCGIIPAYAGNTSLARLCRRVRRDHPRVCGEHHGGLSP